MLASWLAALLSASAADGRAAQLSVSSSADGLLLSVQNPRFYDLDQRRIGDWDRLRADPGWRQLLERWAADLEQGGLSLCDDRRGQRCEPCERCSVRVVSVRAAEGGPLRGVNGRLASSMLEVKPLAVGRTRGRLCAAVEETPAAEGVAEVFAPPVRVDLLVSGAPERPFVRLRFPGWTEPFVADAYGLEVALPDGPCRMIEPFEHPDLPPAVMAPLPLRAPAAPPAPLRAVGLPGAPVARPFDPHRDPTEVEVVRVSGRSITLEIRRPWVMNLDASALSPGAPGHGWDLWDPEGWSPARCRRFRSLQCLLFLYAHGLVASAELTLVGGERIACGRGCSLDVLELGLLDPAAKAPEDAVLGLAVQARVPRGTGCSDCVLAGPWAGTGSSVQFLVLPARVVVQLQLPDPPGPVRQLELRHPGLTGAGNWFAGVDLGLSLVDESGGRIGRARRFCTGSIVQSAVFVPFD